MIIKKLKKNKIKEESKKKSKEPKNVKKNHPCFSLMQRHTIFNMKKQCNVFLPHILLTCCQFQHLKYSIYISIYQYNYLSIYLSIYLDDPNLLNKKSELINKCRHLNKILLINVKR